MGRKREGQKRDGVRLVSRIVKNSRIKQAEKALLTRPDLTMAEIGKICSISRRKMFDIKRNVALGRPAVDVDLDVPTVYKRRKDCKLSEDEEDAVATMISDRENDNRHTDYDLIQKHILEKYTKQVSQGWIARFLRKHGFSSQRIQAKCIQRNRPTLKAEIAEFFSNAKRFDITQLWVQDETSIKTDDIPRRSICRTNGKGAHVLTGDKNSSVKVSISIIARLDGQVCLCFCVPSHKENEQQLHCFLPVNLQHHCTCKEKRVDGFNAPLFCYHMQTELPKFSEGDAMIYDNLSSHNNLEIRQLFYDHKLYMLPIPPKSAPETSVLDAGLFHEFKDAIRKDLVKFPIEERTVDTVIQLALKHKEIIQKNIKAYALSLGFERKRGFQKKVGPPSKLQEKDELPFENSVRKAYITERNIQTCLKTAATKKKTAEKRKVLGLQPPKRKPRGAPKKPRQRKTAPKVAAPATQPSPDGSIDPK